jgi:hypothetical protein
MRLETVLPRAEFAFLTGSRAASRAVEREDLLRWEPLFQPLDCVLKANLAADQFGTLRDKFALRLLDAAQLPPTETQKRRFLFRDLREVTLSVNGLSVLIGLALF